MILAHLANEGLRLARFMMVLSSLSPLFLLWAVRGIPTVPDFCLWATCGLLIGLPNAILYLRIRLAKKRGDTATIKVNQADDHREHLLVYLFAMLLPLYDLNLGEERDFFAAVIAVTFIVFLFYHLHMYYMNLMFALLGYRVFTIHPTTEGDRLSREDRFVLLTFRPSIRANQEILAIRISNSVYFEPRSKQ
jgi:hypothetical protein